MVCRQLGLGHASDAVQTNFFGGERVPMSISGLKCFGNEINISECLHDQKFECPGKKKTHILMGVFYSS